MKCDTEKNTTFIVHYIDNTLLTQQTSIYYALIYWSCSYDWFMVSCEGYYLVYIIGLFVIYFICLFEFRYLPKFVTVVTVHLQTLDIIVFV